MNKLLIKENYKSLNLFNKMKLVEIKTINNFTEGLEWVKNKNIDGVLIGGTAVVNYLGSGRDLTPDIDFLVRDIKDVMNKLNESNKDFKPIKDGKLGIIGITVPDFNMDFLDYRIGNSKLNDLILKNSTTTVIGGETINIVRPELLTISKFDIGRDKDINDAFNLLSSGALNKKTYETFVNTLKNELIDYQSLIGYSEIIK